MDLIIKAILGAAVVILIQLIAGTKNYFIAGLVPLFPTFSLISHYIVGSQRSTSDLRATILFSIVSIGPYLLYSASLYFLVARLPLIPSLIIATVIWFISAGLLVFFWTRAGMG
ncbi:MAG: GlpM family protein [Chloroflexota bacterium]